MNLSKILRISSFIIQKITNKNVLFVMAKSINWRKIIIFSVPLLLILTMFLLVQTPAFHQSPDTFSLAITLDLLVTLPLIYFLLIRNKNIPKYTIISVFIIGVIAATFIIPKDNQYYLTQIKFWVVPVLELSILSFIFFKIKKTFAAIKTATTTTPDFYSAVVKVTKSALPPRVSSVFATEIAVIYYGLLSWRKRPLQANEFTYHKRSAIRELLVILMFMIVGETAAIHLLLHIWSPTAAWILTFLSIYTLFQVFGILKSMPHRPIVIGEKNLFLRYGLLNDATISLADIESIKLERKGLEFNNDVRRLSSLGEIDSYNVILRLKNQQTMTGLYGFSKTFKTIAFHVDNKEAFAEKLKLAMG